jgi:hypothetical protein
MRKSLSVVVLSLVLCVASASSAEGANIIVGSPLTGTFTASTFGSSITAFNSNLPVGNVTSPVDGVIVGWHLLDGSGGPYYLRVLDPVGGEYTAVGKSAPEIPVSTGTERFTTALPIEAGETIAIEGTATTDGLAVKPGPGGEFSFFFPELAEGATAPPAVTGLPAELGFNAEVQPSPTITLLGTTSGPTTGGTSVTIAGTNFVEVKSVDFGSTAAPFLVNSEGQITATAPPGSAGSVPISVTTIAGTGTSSQQFTYQTTTTSGPAPTPTPAPISARTCTVPKLKGKSLKASKTMIKGAGCKFGKVTKKKGAKAATGKVVGQSRKPGTVLPAGTVVGVTLGKG